MRPQSLALTAVFLMATACNDDEAINPSALDAGADAAGGGSPCLTTSFGDSSPVTYGLAAIDTAIRDTGKHASVRVVLTQDTCLETLPGISGTTLGAAAESFALVPNGDETIIVGRDEVGAMYGAFEVEERLRRGDPLPPQAVLSKAPSVPFRAANLFLTIPLPGESSWWFLDESFWTAYLDMLAKARFNVLDLHGMYEFAKAEFPNALPYFATSKSYPQVGVPEADRARNLAMLRQVIDMAGARGIKVGLMTYRTDVRLDSKSPPPNLSDAAVSTYTREAAEALAREAPKLNRLGFRIGESNHAPSWYAGTFIEGVRAAGGTVGLYTRSWLTAKPDIVELASAAGKDMLVEVKYNGEQLGPPYVVAGGLMSQGAKWPYYSYEDYLDPPLPHPYQFAFQIRSGGTHRIFRHASVARIRRTVADSMLGTSLGFSLEAPHAYFPMRDDYHKKASDRFSTWTFRRDELQYHMFGRLAYDPATEDTVFRDLLVARTNAAALFEPLEAASDIIPWIESAHQCGPDQRHFAPDLEWGGTVGYWATAPSTTDKAYCDTQYHGPLDTFAFSSPYEAGRALATGKEDARVSPVEVAAIVLRDAAAARVATSVSIDPTNAEARDIVRECVALADFGEYFAHKLRGATALAVFDATGSAQYLQAAKSETELADAAWRALSSDTAYLAAIEDPMRMKALGFSPYHFSMIDASLDEDRVSIQEHEALVTTSTNVVLEDATKFLLEERADPYGLEEVTVATVRDQTQPATVRFKRDLPEDAKVHVLWKGFSGYDDWQAEEATRVDARTYKALVSKSENAGFFAAEIFTHDGFRRRYPDVRTTTPYFVVSP